MKQICIIFVLILSAGATLAQNSCINSSFENADFSNWDGSKGNSTLCGDTITQHPFYTITNNGIFSTYQNVNILDTSAYHTIVDNSGNLATSSGVYYLSIPYDTFAVNSSSIHEIPFVSPFFSDNYSVRLNNIGTPYHAAQITYTINNACTKKLDYAFAVILNDGGHAIGTNPFFMVKIFDQNMNGLDSTIITISPNDTNIKPSSVMNAVWYRKWEKKTFDFTSPTYSNVTTAYIQFTSGDCCYGGHFGYAYIDAQCSVVTSSCVLGVNNYTQGKIEIIPNPANDFIQVILPHFSEINYYQITDITGHICMQGILNTEKKQIPISNLNDGIYYLIIENSFEKYHQKIIIKK